MKKRSLSTLILSFAFLGLLVACNSGGTDSSVSSSSASSSSNNDAVTVEFWHTFGQKSQEALQKKADEFSKLILTNTGAKVTISLKYQGSYDDIESKITKGFGAANIPTMAIAYPDHIANYLESEGSEPGRFVYNIDSYMSDSKIGFGTQSYLGDSSKYGKDDFVGAFLKEGQQFVRSGTYSLPYMKSSEVMFYNKEALAKALTYFKPSIVGDSNIASYIGSISWDEFIQLCASIKEHKADISSAIKTPAWYDDDSNLFISKMYQNNIPYSSIGSDSKGVIDFESGDSRTKAEAMVTGIKTAYDNGLLVTKGTEGTYGSDAFTNMETVFSIGSSGGTGYNMPSGDAFNVGVTRVPVSNNNPQFVSQGPNITFLKNPSYTTAENDKRMNYAWQFAKYITNPETNVYMCVYGSEGYIPVRYSAYETEDFTKFLEEGEIYAKTADVLLNDIDGHYLNTSVFKGSATLRDQCGGIITSVLKQNTNVTTAFNAAINATKLKM
jgi:multiple sugar transport system substrate-binding protein